MSARIDEAANTVVKIASYKQREVRMRDSRAACHRCGRLLKIYSCENGTFAVQCGKCETVTLVQAQNPEQAAMKVGVTAIPLAEWSDDEGDVIAMRWPARDTSDICIGCPGTEPQSIPDDFTHFIRLPFPRYSADG